MANISNHTEYAPVYGTSDADNIDNFAKGAGVYAFEGDDLIRDFYAQYSTVQGYGGNDTIYNANSNDRINLSATLDQITGANVTSSGVNLNFSDGSSLAVAGTVGATFALTDGSTFVADQSTGQFTRTN